MHETIYQRNAHTDTSVVGERVIVFERASKSASVLNPTGAQVWNSLATPQTSAQLNAALQAQFPDAPAAQLQSDVETYLQQLLAQKLIERAPA